jgi:hypothetical protein
VLNGELINEREALLIYRPANGIIALLLTLVLISNADAACSVSGGCGVVGISSL